jgi:hypothetical protein
MRNGPLQANTMIGGMEGLMRETLKNGVHFYRVKTDDDEPVWGKIMVLHDEHDLTIGSSDHDLALRHPGISSLRSG